MSRRFICTVGTSASQDVMRQEPLKSRFGAGGPARLTAEVVTALGGEDAAVAAMAPHFLALDHRDDETLRRKLSAEVHSLVRLAPSPGDEVHLLATDTPDGRVCARLVEAFVAQRMGLPAGDVQVRSIEGLQVDDGERFRRVGVVNYIQEVRRLGDERAWHGVVLNPTGGFKALIPYTTLLGMLFRARVSYIFDNGRELIDLPPLPIEFNLPLLRPRLEALEELEAKVELTEDRFWRGATQEQREALAALVETTRRGWVTLSGLGLVALERLRNAGDTRPCLVFLSAKAWEDYAAAPRKWNCASQIEWLLGATRQQVEEAIDKKRDGSRWLKPGRTDDRWRVEWEGTNLLVYRIVGHDEYERMLGRTQWPRSAYAPFISAGQPPIL